MTQPSAMRSLGAGVLLAVLASVTWAAPGNAGQDAATPAGTPAVGDATRGALAIQRSGSQSGEAIPLRGEQAALSHKRYLDSFTHPIPQHFSSTTGGAGSGQPGASTPRQ